MTYEYKQALKASEEYFNGNELAAKVFVDKYAMKDEEGNLIELTPTDMHWRIAKELARVEKTKFGDEAMSKEEIFNYLDGFKHIVPQGGVMFGVDNPNYVSLSNCYLCDSPVDSYGGIMWTDEQIVQISKRRGGASADLSLLRPCGTPTKNSSGSSTGVVAFANRFSNTTREVGQLGRRGACMLSLDVHHPDILSFINCKRDKTKVTGANISVRLSNEFLTAAANNEYYEQRWTKTDETVIVTGMIDARLVWNDIIKNAHTHAEPGILFWDKILSESPADCYIEFQTMGVNPCSEIPLSELDSCRLLLLNSLSYVNNKFTKDASFDWGKFHAGAIIAQRLHDDIVDLELECLSRIIEKIEDDKEDEEIKSRELAMWKRVRKNCDNGRRTGTGLTAIGDTLASLGIPYGSEKAIDFVERLYRTLKFGCYESSISMAKKLGPFPVFCQSKEWDDVGGGKYKEKCDFFERFSRETCVVDDREISGADLMRKMFEYGRRNIACLTTAPAGSVSVLTQTTSGIEPLYFPSSVRRKKGNPGDAEFRSDFVDESGDHWMEFEIFHPQVQNWMLMTGEKDISKSPWYGNCAEDLDWGLRIELLAAAQQHVDHSISITINIPADATVEDVEQIYTAAWKAGVKGITVYRKGSRDGVILDKKELDKQRNSDIIEVKRPKILPCKVHHTSVQGQSYFILVGLLNGNPYEVFAGKNGFIPKKVKSGQITRKRKNFYIVDFDDTDIHLSPITASTTEMEEIITRLTSLSLREGADMHRVVQQLEKVGESKDMNCFARGVARILKKYIPDGTKENEKCPECQADAVVRQEGCVLCQACGASKCS